MAKKVCKSNSMRSIDLRALEEEVLGEGLLWMQRRMEEKLREKRESFPPGGEVAPAERPEEKVDD